jgi:hypothetical protein
MQIRCVCLIYGGLESSHLTWRNTAFQTAADFSCHLKVINWSDIVATFKNIISFDKRTLLYCYISNANLLSHDFCTDRRKAEGILTRCYLNREAPEWR